MMLPRRPDIPFAQVDIDTLTESSGSDSDTSVCIVSSPSTEDGFHSRRHTPLLKGKVTTSPVLLPTPYTSTQLLVADTTPSLVNSASLYDSETERADVDSNSTQGPLTHSPATTASVMNDDQLPMSFFLQGGETRQSIASPHSQDVLSSLLHPPTSLDQLPSWNMVNAWATFVADAEKESDPDRHLLHATPTSTQVNAVLSSFFSAIPVRNAAVEAGQDIESLFVSENPDVLNTPPDEPQVASPNTPLMLASSVLDVANFQLKSGEPSSAVVGTTTISSVSTPAMQSKLSTPVLRPKSTAPSDCENVPNEFLIRPSSAASSVLSYATAPPSDREPERGRSLTRSSRSGSHELQWHSSDRSVDSVHEIRTFPRTDSATRGPPEYSVSNSCSRSSSPSLSTELLRPPRPQPAFIIWDARSRSRSLPLSRPTSPVRRALPDIPFKATKQRGQLGCSQGLLQSYNDYSSAMPTVVQNRQMESIPSERTASMATWYTPDSQTRERIMNLRKIRRAPVMTDSTTTESASYVLDIHRTNPQPHFPECMSPTSTVPPWRRQPHPEQSPDLQAAPSYCNSPVPLREGTGLLGRPFANSGIPPSQPIYEPARFVPRVFYPASSYPPSTSPSVPNSPPPPPHIMHPRFWFEDGSVVFRVERTLYKVHRYFFEQHSIYFRTLLQSYTFTQGCNNEPVNLSGISTIDFDRLLAIFYPTNFLNVDLNTVEDWTSVLALGSDWVFVSLRELAISKLAPLASPVERVVLGKRYNVDIWLVPAYRELCLSGRPLAKDDATKLGMDDVIKIWQMQQELYWLIPRDEAVMNGNDGELDGRIAQMFILGE